VEQKVILCLQKAKHQSEFNRQPYIEYFRNTCLNTSTKTTATVH